MTDVKLLELFEKSSKFLKYRPSIKRLLINHMEKRMTPESISKIIKSCSEELTISWFETTDLGKIYYMKSLNLSF